MFLYPTSLWTLVARSERGLWISTEYTAKKSLDALARNKMRVVPGLTSKAMSAASQYAPRAIVAPIVGTFYKKMGG